MATYSYFPGCSLDGTSREYGQSTIEVCNALGAELVELEDWNCCGATSAHSTNRLWADALAGRNLVLAGRTGNDLVVPCAACYNRTKRAGVALAEATGARRAQLEDLIGQPIDRLPKVRHLLEVLSTEAVIETLADRRCGALPSVKAACYYGCLLVRPSEAGMDDAEDPQTMERLLSAGGVESCEWYFKNECCGASLSIPQSESVIRLVEGIVRNARAVGADWIVTACPLCQVNLESRQKPPTGESPIPVLYITQVLGLGLGLEPRALGVPPQIAALGGGV